MTIRSPAEARVQVDRNADRLGASERVSPRELSTLKDGKVTQEDFDIAHSVHAGLMRDAQRGGGTRAAFGAIAREVSELKENLIDAGGLRPRLDELVKQQTALLPANRTGVDGMAQAYGNALGQLLRELPAK